MTRILGFKSTTAVVAVAAASVVVQVAPAKAQSSTSLVPSPSVSLGGGIAAHVLQVTIMSRTVALSPLSVLVSVLFGVELFGLLGALLAIPIAGIIKVLVAEAVRIARPDLVLVSHYHRHLRSPFWKKAPAVTQESA